MDISKDQNNSEYTDPLIPIEYPLPTNPVKTVLALPEDSMKTWPDEKYFLHILPSKHPIVSVYLSISIVIYTFVWLYM